MTRIAAPSLSPLLPGKKLKYVSSDGGQVNVLHTLADRYVVTKKQHQGRFGKFRYAMNNAGQTFAVKEFRLPSRPGPHPHSTQVSPPHMVSAEIAAVRNFGGSAGVHDVADVDGKVYMLTPLMAGTLHDLRGEVGPSGRYVLARQVLLHVARQLHGLYRRGYVHRDIKDTNILYNRAGDFLLCDFGMAAPLHSMQQDGGTWGYMPPEYVLHDRLTPRYDVFSLGMCIADIHIRALRPDPRDAKQNIKASQSFVQWRQRLIEPRTGRVDVQRIGSSLFWSATERRWNGAFKQLREIDPTLCQFVLERMLEPQPERRASLAEVERMALWLSWKTPGAREKLSSVVAQLRSPTREAALAGLQRARQSGYLSLGSAMGPRRVVRYNAAASQTR